MMKICLIRTLLLILNIILLKKGIIAQIFDEHWEEVYSNNKDIIDKMQPNADTKIRKVIDCANKDLSCCAYECPI